MKTVGVLFMYKWSGFGGQFGLFVGAVWEFRDGLLVVIVFRAVVECYFSRTCGGEGCADDVAEYGALVDSLQRGEFQAAFDLIFSSHELWSRVLTMHPFLLIRKTEIKN